MKTKWFTLIEFLIIVVIIWIIVVAIGWCWRLNKEWKEYKEEHCRWLSDEDCLKEWQDKNFRETYCYDLTEDECTELKIKVRADDINSSTCRSCKWRF